MATERLREAVETYEQAQDALLGARNQLAVIIAGAAMGGMTRDEIVNVTGYCPDHLQKLTQDYGSSRRP